MPNIVSVKTDAKTLWKGVLADLQTVLSPSVFKMWVEVTKAENLTDTSIDIICPSSYIKNNIEKKLYPLIEEKVNEMGGKKYKLNLLIRGTDHEGTAIGVNKTETPLFETLPEKNSSDTQYKASSRFGLSPKYTFENYLMGANNRMAYAIATAVADAPGKQYNPFFLYSGVGLGKTHLIQAIGNKVLQKNPNAKVIYCTSETFTNELIETLQKGKRNGKYTANEFRDKYRKADVLLIDDIQFIVGRGTTQEEFFHTFNALQMNQKQIVLTSDRPPKDFANLEERLTSRFGAGIIADIQPPDLEMRVAILRSKRDAENDVIPNEVIDLIAESVSTNIRELVAAYLQVVTEGTTAGQEITIEEAARILGQSIRKEQLKPVNLNQILKAVCNYYSVNSADIKGEKRTRDLVIPRHVAMYLIKDLTKTPYVSIGDFLGGRDHTTIMHGVEKVTNEIGAPTKTRQDIVNIKQIIYTK